MSIGIRNFGISCGDKDTNSDANSEILRDKETLPDTDIEMDTGRDPNVDLHRPDDGPNMKRGVS